jgi:hypothetical protein
MSNFAATSIPILGRLSPLYKTTSEIIDAFSNANYVFMDVSVEFRIRFPLRFLGLRAPRSFEGFNLPLEYDGEEAATGCWRNLGL